MTLFDRLTATTEGKRQMAAAGLRYEALKQLNRALLSSGMTQADLARALGVRKSAVSAVFKGNGNLHLNTFAEYMAAMGEEVHLNCAALGAEEDARQRRLREKRAADDVRLDAKVTLVSFVGLSPAPTGKSWEPTSYGASDLTHVSAADSKRSDFALAG